MIQKKLIYGTIVSTNRVLLTAIILYYSKYVLKIRISFVLKVLLLEIIPEGLRNDTYHWT